MINARVLDAQARSITPVTFQPSTRTHAAVTSRFLGDMTASSPLNADVNIANSIVKSRALARYLADNNDYMRQWLRLVKDNIVGATGFILQMKAMDVPATPNGQPQRDKWANKYIEDKFAEWSKKGNCDITGRYSFRKIQELFWDYLGRDGEFIAIMYRGAGYGRYGFQLYVVEPDMLDETYSIPRTASGTMITMGVEQDLTGKPIRYYFRNPEYRRGLSSGYAGSISGNAHIVVDAKDVLHVYDADRVTQSRGISWSIASVIRLQMLSGFEEATLVNARSTASTQGFIETTIQPGDAADSTDDDGNAYYDQEAGIWRVLPKGTKAIMMDPKFPTEQHGPFVKTTLRGIASGLGLNYNEFANDYEGVNFSSLRQAALTSRETWKRLQAMMVENFFEPLFAEWLRMMLLSPNTQLPINKYEKFLAANWIGKRWGWVDPTKDIKARALAIEMGLDTRTNTVAELTGKDFEDVISEQAEELALMRKYGIIEPTIDSVKKSGAE